MPRTVDLDQLKYVRRNIISKIRRRQRPGCRRVKDMTRLHSELRAIDDGIAVLTRHIHRVVKANLPRKDARPDPHRKDGHAEPPRKDGHTGPHSPV